MMAAVLIVLATALLGAATDAVVESAIDGGDAIVMFGQTVATPGAAGTLGILTAVSAGAVLAWVAAIAHARGRRLERRLTEELDERWEDLSQRVAGELGRKTLLEWRVVELRNQVDELVTKRDELLEEMNAVRERTSELQRMIRQQREAALALVSEPGTYSQATDMEGEAASDEAGDETVAAEAEMEAVEGGGEAVSEDIVVLPEVGRPAGMRLVGAEEPASGDAEEDGSAEDASIEDAARATADGDATEGSEEDEIISVVEPEPAMTGEGSDETPDDPPPWR